jgi:hypothetical protein
MTTNKYRKQQRAQLKVEVVKCWLTTEPSGEAVEMTSSAHNLEETP